MDKQYKNHIKILFVCHGNICRSPLAEYILRDMVTKRGDSAGFYIASAATSTEEIGNPVHPPPGGNYRSTEFPVTENGRFS